LSSTIGGGLQQSTDNHYDAARKHGSTAAQTLAPNGCSNGTKETTD
jgi:hypothetical protein